VDGVTIDEIQETYIRVNVLTIENLNILCKIFDKHREKLGIISYKKKFINMYEHCQSFDELFRHYNISDAFKEFDFDKNYGMYQYENMVFIKLRFCDIDNWGKILSNIFGRELTMTPTNLAKEKFYYEKYLEFKNNYKVPRSFIKELLKDEHFNAYNTVEEKRQYLKYWMDRSV
jgi:hypothetical protein